MSATRARDRRIHVHALDAEGYAELELSVVLPGIDLVLLARLAELPNQSAAVRELRQSMRR